MNCKPDQLAWIVVPRHYVGTGLEQLNGHIVRTVCLLPDQPEPTWEVTPKQRVRMQVTAVDRHWRTVHAGELMEAAGIPDSFLRPFDPGSVPREDEAANELAVPA